jgi:putative aldouronate transport system substrate-binding protein
VACISSGLFNGNVKRNAFLSLDNYIQHIPSAKKLLPEAAFQALSNGGKLYGVHAYKDLAEVWGVLYNQDLFDEFGVKMPEKYETEMDLIPLYYQVTEAFRKANPNNPNCVVKPSTYLNSWFLYDSLYGSFGNPLVVTNIPGCDGFKSVTDANKVFSPYLTDDYLNYVKTLWQMGQDDIIPVAAGDGDARWSEGQAFTQTSCGWIEIDPHMFSDSWKTGWYPADKAILTTSQLQVNINVINARCENPELAAKFLEMTYSDEYLCTTLKFGIKGMDWDDANNDGIVEMLERNSDPTSRFWYHWYGARNSSVLGGKLAQGSSAEFPQKLEALNASGISSNHAGFVFDPEPVLNEIAACENVLAKYDSQLDYPAFKDPQKFVEDFRSELKANGIDKIVAEAQRQLDEWHKANGK